MRRASLALLFAAAGCGGTIEPGGDGGGADLATTVDGGATADLATSAGDLGGFAPAPHPPWPQLAKGGGRVLAPMKLVAITAQNDARAATLAAYVDGLAQSQWWKAVGAEYGVGAATVVHATGPAIGQTIAQSQIEAYISNAGVPPPDGNTYYHLFIPDGTSVLDGNNQPVTYCGAHDPLGSMKGDGWGWSRACSFLGDPLASLESTTSHEAIEAATDSLNGWTLGVLGGSPWKSSIWLTLEPQGNVENADLCEGTVDVEGGATYQRSWSNAAAQAGGDPCVPARPEPYVNVSAPEGWYAVGAGQSVAVTLTGFSTGPTVDWALAPFLRSGNSNGFVATIDGGSTVKIGNKSYPGVHNGSTATLHVTAPNAGSGTWASIIVISYPPAPSADKYHYWLVGFYVP